MNWIEDSDPRRYAGLRSHIREFLAAEDQARSDSYIHAAVVALLATRQWADEAGVTFRWDEMPSPDLAKTHQERAIYPEWCCDYDSGERLWRCSAYRDGELIGVNEGWPAGTPTEEFARLHVEGELSVWLIGDFNHFDGYERVATHANNLREGD